jgi:hypothetical protein
LCKSAPDRFYICVLFADNLDHSRRQVENNYVNSPPVNATAVQMYTATLIILEYDYRVVVGWSSSS